jgi:hypothetical protein
MFRLHFCLIPVVTLSIAAACFAQTEVQARRASDFVNAMGINVHLENNATLPDKDYELVNSALKALGMRHFRDEINHADKLSPAIFDPVFVHELHRVGSLGYRLCGVIEGGNDYPLGPTLEASHVIPMIQSLLPTIDVVEGPNEPDDPNPSFTYGGQRYPRGAVRESLDLWNIVKGSSKISDLPVLAMSEGKASDFKKLAKLKGVPPPSEYTTYGNMHAYQGGGVGDSGLGGYIRLSQDWTGSEPLWTTEMGYHNDTNYLSDGEQQGVSERASAIYLPIAFLSGFNHNIVRTFSYELVNEAVNPPLTKCSAADQLRCSGEGYYGLLNYDFTPKPAYTALKNLVELLYDSESNFAPRALELTFSGAPDSMRYTLLQKSTGDYYLALWNDVSAYQVATCLEFENNTCKKSTPGMDIYPPNVPITVTFSDPQDFSVYALDDASGVKPTGAYTISASPRSIKLELPPGVLLIKLRGDK